MQITGAKMVLEIFKLEGVKVMFGYPGGAIMNVYDEIYKQDEVKHILVRHEQAAIHAAEGYARSTGEVGVAVVTSGPGFTNAVTGLATAYMDSIPLVVLSGQVPLPLIGTDGFQEIDATGISRPCTKHNYLIKDVRDIPRVFKEAFYIAKTGRPGPVLIDLPKDISIHHHKFIYPESVDIPTYKPTYKGHTKQIKNVVEAIYHANRPILYLGGGIVRSNAEKEIREMAKICQIPSLETVMARGVIGDDDPLSLGMVGMHGTYAANMAMSESDLLISIGARFDDRVTGKVSEFGKNAKIIHIDIDPANIDKIIDVDYPIVGDIKAVITEMLPFLKERINPSHYFKWREHLEGYKKAHPLIYKDSDELLKPQWVIQELGEQLGDRAIVSVDVGQHQMWAAQFYPFSHAKQFISSSGLGTMGFGFPAGMGVKVANPDKVALNITGDGSIMMNIQELTTCVQHNIPVINVILNNTYLGMVRQWQSFFYNDRFSEVDLTQHPDFVKLAEAFGGVGYRVHTKEAFKKALQEAIDSKKVALIDVVVERNENVLPMIPAGAALDEIMVLDPKDKESLIVPKNMETKNMDNGEGESK